MDIYLGIFAFTLIVALLVAFVMFARSQLVSTGDVTIEINGDPEKKITVPTGGKLLTYTLLQLVGVVEHALSANAK